MTRLSFDALHLQSQMANGQELTIEQIAKDIFGELLENGDRQITKVSMLRAKRAATNMVALKRAEPIKGMLGLAAIRAKYHTQGTQLEALMNMAVRSAVIGRQSESPEDDPPPVLEVPEKEPEATIEVPQQKDNHGNHPRRSKRSIRSNGRKNPDA